MKNLSLENITTVCDGTYYGSQEDKELIVDGVVLDSRKIQKGYLFIATKGEQVNGHSYITEVFEKGAMCALGEEEPKVDQKPYIKVENSFQALKKIAKFYRQQLSVKVVGISGSVGKTSSKEFIASVLSEKYSVLKTEGNFNNEVGLPLTILQLREEHQVAVLEMGISDFGEMHRLSDIARPDICVLTNIGQCHLEFLKSREGILQAKTEIFDFMQEDGSVCINGDDDMLKTITLVKNKVPVSFGLNPDNDIYADEIVEKGLLGSEVTIRRKEEWFKAEIPLPGIHMIYNALCSVAVGRLLGLSSEEMKRGLRKVQSVGGRSNIIQHKEMIIIDDCYNANPISMKAAIDLLCTASGRKTAILGDMFELGRNEKKLHEEIGEYAVIQGIDTLICIGELSYEMYGKAVEMKRKLDREVELQYYSSRQIFINHLQKKEFETDTILVKASRGMQFEYIIKALQ